MGRLKIFKNNNIKLKSKKQNSKESSSRTDVSLSSSILCLKYILSHSSLNQDNNPSYLAFCDNYSFNPFLPVGTGNNPTLSASHHTKHVPFSSSEVQNFSPHHMSIIRACLKHEPQLFLDKTPTFHTCENGTVIKSKPVLSSVEKPRNLTCWEWVFSQTLPVEWREPQIYSVIKIVFFHFIFHYMASFFLCCSIL